MWDFIQRRLLPGRWPFAGRRQRCRLHRSTLILARYSVGLALLKYQRAHSEIPWGDLKAPKGKLYGDMERHVKDAFDILIRECDIIEDDCSPQALRGRRP